MTVKATKTLKPVRIMKAMKAMKARTMLLPVSNMKAMKAMKAKKTPASTTAQSVVVAISDKEILQLADAFGQKIKKGFILVNEAEGGDQKNFQGGFHFGCELHQGVKALMQTTRAACS